MAFNLDVVRTASAISDSVVVGFSGGKDSAATLDLCFSHFKTVKAYFMYIVPNLEFQEQTLRLYEKKYGMEILRIPHFMLSDFLKFGAYRMPDDSVPLIKVKDSYQYIREQTGIRWIAAGERIKDSIIRRAMIKKSSAIDFARGRFYPLAYWDKKSVLEYNAFRKLPLSLENKVLGFSFRSLMAKDMAIIKAKFPEDFEKIKRFFPFIEASVKKYEIENQK